jgi:hypothetical protein
MEYGNFGASIDGFVLVARGRARGCKEKRASAAMEVLVRLKIFSMVQKTSDTSE